MNPGSVLLPGFSVCYYIHMSNPSDHIDFRLHYRWQLITILNALKAQQHSPYITELERSGIQELIRSMEGKAYS